jgi:hypothetical protein
MRAGATRCASPGKPAQRGLIVYGEGDVNCSASGRIEAAGGGLDLVPAGEGDCRIPLHASKAMDRDRAGPAACAYYCGPGATAYSGKSFGPRRRKRDAGHRPRRRSALLTFTET